MNKNDVRILRSAALELQAHGDDIVRVAGVVQRIKNWWKARFSPEFAEEQDKVEEAYYTMKEPLVVLMKQLKQLETALKDNDPNSVAKIVTEVPRTISKFKVDVEELSEAMQVANEAIPEQIVDEDGKVLYDSTKETVTRGYNKDKKLLAELWEKLPEDFKEIPIGKEINRPITDFKWFRQYEPEKIVFSPEVLSRMKGQLKTALTKREENDNFIFDEKFADEIIDYGYQTFVKNLQHQILSDDCILYKVNFPDISKRVSNRPVNEMKITVIPGVVDLPFGTFKIPFDIRWLVMHDIEAAALSKKSLRVFIVGGIALESSAYNKLMEIKRLKDLQEYDVQPELEPDSEETDEGVLKEDEDNGPITSVIRQAILENWANSRIS